MMKIAWSLLAFSGICFWFGDSDRFVWGAIFSFSLGVVSTFTYVMAMERDR